MAKRHMLMLLVAVAVVAGLLAIPLTAGGEEGRGPGATPGEATSEEAPSGGDGEAVDGWDGDGPAPRDVVFNDDLIVDGSACIGQDCVNGESFGFDTLRLKENNLRIKFDDTSNSASFPRNDWQITANESTNGGAEKFSIDDISNSRIPFTIEASTPTNSLYVRNSGNIGFGTGAPVVELHVVDGDTPTLRLQQDGSSGFTPQTWDLAGNETNFFLRDVTNGSRLPFRIRPGAPTSALDIAANGDIQFDGEDNGVLFTTGDNSPDGFIMQPNTLAASNDAIQVLRLQSGGGTRLVISDEFGQAYLIEVVQTGAAANGLRLASFSSGIGLVIDPSGNVTMEGNLTVSGTCTGC